MRDLYYLRVEQSILALIAYDIYRVDWYGVVVCCIIGVLLWGISMEQAGAYDERMSGYESGRVTVCV